jgi:hypothetical protein
MAQKPGDGASQTARAAFARSMRQSIVMLRGAHAALPWLEATRRPNVNLGSLYLTEEWARILIGGDVDLVVVPDPEFMYATTSWPFSAVINYTAGFTPSNHRRPVVLNYPLSDADRLLLHPVFAHELSHASVDQYDLVTSVESELNADQGFVAAFQDAVNNMAAGTRLTQTQVSGTIRGWLHDWIEELLCDHLAIEAAGPGFIWSFSAFVMPQGYGEPGREHPPNTVRMKFALEHLTDRGWRPYLERIAPQITHWLDQIAEDAIKPLEEPFEFMRSQLLANAHLFRNTAHARAGADSLDPAMSEVEAGEAAGLLRDLVLPVGLAETLEGRAILLGGWERAFEAHGDNPTGLVSSLRDTRLQELVGKAIEMSTVVSAWEANS